MTISLIYAPLITPEDMKLDVLLKNNVIHNPLLDTSGRVRLGTVQSAHFILVTRAGVIVSSIIIFIRALR